MKLHQDSLCADDHMSVIMPVGFTKLDQVRDFTQSSYYLHTCCKLLRPLVSTLWIKDLNKQFVYIKLVDKLEQTCYHSAWASNKKTYDIGKMTARQEEDLLQLVHFWPCRIELGTT